MSASGKYLLAATGVAIAALSCLGANVSAQDELPPIAPIEVLTCHYLEGKGPADLAGVAAGFNDWMERNEAPAYTAFALSPLSHSDEIDFDLAWVGAWPDGATMGASMAHSFKWAMGYGSYESFGRDYDEFNNGGGIDTYNQLFEPLMRCDSPRLYAVQPIRTDR